MEDLLRAAQQAQENAYAPYSGYRVGAALRSSSGQVYAGCNVENVSYGLTLCAERNALAAMVTAGETRWTEIVIITRDGGTPCGACLQVLLEFVEDARNASVICASESSGPGPSRMLAEFLPLGFRSPEVGRTES